MDLRRFEQGGGGGGRREQQQAEGGKRGWRSDERPACEDLERAGEDPAVREQRRLSEVQTLGQSGQVSGVECRVKGGGRACGRLRRDRHGPRDWTAHFEILSAAF